MTTDTLSDLRKQEAEIKRRLIDSERRTASILAELRTVKMRIDNHIDFQPRIVKPKLFENFDNGKVHGLPKEYKIKSQKLYDLSGLDDLDL